MIKRMSCKVLGHNYRVIKKYSVMKQWQDIECTRCKKRWISNHGFNGLTTWTKQLDHIGNTDVVKNAMKINNRRVVMQSNVAFIGGIGRGSNESKQFKKMAAYLDVELISLKWQHFIDGSGVYKNAVAHKSPWRKLTNAFSASHVLDAVLIEKYMDKILDSFEDNMSISCNTIIAHSAGTHLACRLLERLANKNSTRKFNVVLISNTHSFYAEDKQEKYSTMNNVLNIWHKRDYIANEYNRAGVTEKRVKLWYPIVHTQYLKKEKVFKIIRDFLK